MLFLAVFPCIVETSFDTALLMRHDFFWLGQCRLFENRSFSYLLYMVTYIDYFMFRPTYLCSPFDISTADIP